jgi:molybdate transport system ATP-binding protein
VLLGSRVFLLEQGHVIAEGPPLEVLSAARTPAHASIAWDGLRNVFRGRLLDHVPDHSASRVALQDGPTLIVPGIAYPPDAPVLVEIRADDIILARQPVTGLSARNQISGCIERVIRHGLDAEAVVRTGGLSWIVSLIFPAVEQLDLVAGCEVQMIVKSRSCHVSVDSASREDLTDIAQSAIVK